MKVLIGIDIVVIILYHTLLAAHQRQGALPMHGGGLWRRLFALFPICVVSIMPNPSYFEPSRTIVLRQPAGGWPAFGPAGGFRRGRFWPLVPLIFDL